MDLLRAQQQLLNQLKTIYDDREAANIAGWVMEKSTGLKRIDRLLRKNEPLTTTALESVKRYGAELLTHRPVQYVLHESWFCGLEFYVDEQVLIPRPETEELVEWLVASVLSTASLPAPLAPSLLDVGTGSGCIAIAIAKKLEVAKTRPPASAHPSIQAGATPFIHACDISAGALAIARRNASTHQASIDFRQLDFLDSSQWPSLPDVQTIISNPPYIPMKDQTAMARNVVDFEPHLALFVDDDDPLLFYRALAGFARQKLLPAGSLFLEIHEAMAASVMELLRISGFPGITLKKDMQGKDRMIKATR